MQEYFEEQLKNSKPISKEQLKEVKGKSLYSDYQEGDHFLMFMEEEEDPNSDHPSVTLIVRIVVPREFEQLERDYKFVKMSEKFPFLERKQNETSSN